VGGLTVGGPGPFSAPSIVPDGTVPRGLVHRTRAPEKAIVLMVEAASVTPTGDS